MKKLLLILFGLLIISYFIFFPKPIQKKFTFIHDWQKNLDEVGSVKNAPDPMNETIAFTSGKWFGYVTEKGRIIFQDKIYYKVALAPDQFINFSNVSDNLVAQNKNGRILYSIETEGYPIFFDDHLFVIGRDGLHLDVYGNSGIKEWDFYVGSLITCLDAKGTNVICGALNGQLVIFKNGTSKKVKLSQQAPGDTIYGCAVNEDASICAVIYGMGPQVFVMLQKEDNHYKEIYRLGIETPIRRGIRIVYIEALGAFLFETYNGAVFIDKKRKPIELQVSGEMRSVVYNRDFGLIAMLYNKADTAELYFYHPRSGYRTSMTIKERADFLDTIGTHFIVGRSGLLIGIKGGLE